MSQPAAAERRSPLWQVLAILALRDRQFWGRSWLRRGLRIAVSAVYGIMLVTLLLLPFENRLAFPGAAFGGWAEPRPELAVRELSLPTRDGETIHAWLSAPPGWRPEQGAILFSHGNGNNLSGWQGTMGLYRDQFARAVLLYDYPGYGKSTGRPTEQGCYDAADAAYDWLVGEGQVPPEEVILIGSSLGGAMATDLAARRPCRMLILVNTFTSFPDIAQARFPILPARWLVSNRMDSAGKIGRVKAPVFVTHGRADRVVPFRMGQRLYELANEPKRFLPLDDHPHRDPDQPAFFAAVREFLAETAAR